MRISLCILLSLLCLSPFQSFAQPPNSRPATPPPDRSSVLLKKSAFETKQPLISEIFVDLLAYEYITSFFAPKGPLAFHRKKLGTFWRSHGSWRLLFAEALHLHFKKLSKEKGQFADELAVWERLSGQKIFLGSPKPERAKRNSVNPAFVRWVIAHLMPSPDQKVGAYKWQTVYDVMLRDYARKCVETYLHLHTKLDLKQEVKAYEKALALTDSKGGLSYLVKRFRSTLPQHKFWDPDGESTDGDYAHPPAVLLGLWMRRHLDGTAPILWEGLRHAMLQFDRDWFQKTLSSVSRSKQK
ncbi:hypothetical protein L6R29_06315 [Myxococcota bacterium]|nr:hypothetical protein [Myxococcota bacterium]